MRRNVLLVDDDPAILDLVSFFLQQSGFIVKTCKDGHSAIHELYSNPYDLVILDISMPHMNGLKTLKTIRTSENLTNIPVIMLTGSKNKDDIITAKKNNVTDYIIKPPSKDDFLKRIELIMGGRPQFEEVILEKEDKRALGSFSLPIRIKSISKNGLILIGPVKLLKESSIKIENLELFKKWNLKRNEFKLTDCVLNDNGEFEYMVSFIGLSKIEHDEIQEWIISESFMQKNKVSAS